MNTVQQARQALHRIFSWRRGTLLSFLGGTFKVLGSFLFFFLIFHLKEKYMSDK